MPVISQVLAQGLLADRPAAGPANNGYFYLATDVNGGTLYHSDGSAWLQAAAALGTAATAVVTVSADTTLPTGNVLAIVSADVLITLPPAAQSAGATITVIPLGNPLFSDGGMQPTGGDTIYDVNGHALAVPPVTQSGETTTIFMSDGMSTWYLIGDN